MARDVAVLGEPIPSVCTVRDVCRHLNFSRRTLYRALEAGQLALVELDRIGKMRRFTGASVAAVARGKWANARIRRLA